MMKNTLYFLYFIAFSGLLSACGASPAVNTEEQSNVDFSEFDTFAYLPAGDTDTSEYRTYLEDRVIREVNYQMENRGYQLDPDDPDLLVLVKTMFGQEERGDRRPVPSSYDYYSPDFFAIRPLRPAYYTQFNTIPRVSGYAGIREVDYIEGTFVVDIIDASSNEIIWRGWSQTPVDRENLDSSINAYIDNIFDEFPVEAADE